VQQQLRFSADATKRSYNVVNRGYAGSAIAPVEIRALTDHAVARFPHTSPRPALPPLPQFHPRRLFDCVKVTLEGTAVAAQLLYRQSLIGFLEEPDDLFFVESLLHV
jgi:hypothetical protein